MELTADILQRAGGCARGVAMTWAKPLGDACKLYEIDTPKRLAAFLAQVGHESAGFTRTVENLNYSAAGLIRTWPSRFTADSAKALEHRPDAIADHVYGGRMGNKDPGDGWRFRGRGLLMNTGRANYEAMREQLLEKMQNVPDIGAMPEILAEPKWAALAACAYWSDHDLNPLADAGDMRGITRRINGGEIGLQDRMARYERAKKALA